MPKQDYNPKAEARKIMPELFAALQQEAKNGKGIARLQAIAALMKLAEPEAMNPGEDDSAVIENTTPPVEDSLEPLFDEDDEDEFDDELDEQV